MADSLEEREEQDEQEQQEANHIASGMSLGMCVGAGLGIVFDHLSMGIALGTLFGMVMGRWIDENQKK